jgi:nucleoside-diphosphate-sugar epimerase
MARALVSERVLVAGCSGFIGSALVSRLARDGSSPAGVSRSTGIDLTCWDRVRTSTGFDVVVNAAGRASVPESYRDPLGFHRDNFLSTLHLLELARLSGARFVHAGSYVYGTPRYLPIDESHPIAAHSPYTASKILAERLCADYHRDFGVPVTVLRIFNVYGPGQRQGFLVPTILEGIRSGTVELADTTPRRDFVHLDDVVDALARAIAWQHEGCEVINIGSGRSTSVAELVGIAVRASGRDVPVRVRNAPRPTEIPDAVADVRKAAVTLGWRPRVDLESGVAHLVRSSGAAA